MAITIYDKYDVAMAKDMWQSSLALVNGLIIKLSAENWLHPTELSNQVLGLKSIMAYLCDNLNADKTLEPEMYKKAVIDSQPDEMLKTVVQRKKNEYIIEIIKELEEFVESKDINKTFLDETEVEKIFDDMISKELLTETNQIVDTMLLQMQQTSMIVIGDDKVEQQVNEMKGLMFYIIDVLEYNGSIILPEDMYCEDNIKAINSFLEISVKRKKEKYMELVVNQVRKEIKK